MIRELTADGGPMTAHTTNPVPFIVTKNDVELREGGILEISLNNAYTFKCGTTERNDR